MEDKRMTLAFNTIGRLKFELEELLVEWHTTRDERYSERTKLLDAQVEIDKLKMTLVGANAQIDALEERDSKLCLRNEVLHAKIDRLEESFADGLEGLTHL